MNRPVAVRAASIDAVKAVHANVTHEKKERRVIVGFTAGAAGLGGAGFGGTVAVGAFDSSLLIGLSLDYRMTN
jgi:L-lactate permease